MSERRINPRKPVRKGKKLNVARVGALSEGRGAVVELGNGTEVAVFNSEGTIYAIENFCPHRGSPLAESRIHENIVECNSHGYQFDVRDGNCLTDSECAIESYEVIVEEGWIKIVV